MVESTARRTPRFVYLSNAALKGDADPASERFGWRLIAANNRPMGRGIRTHASLMQCRAAAEGLHRSVTEAAHSAVLDVLRGHWMWRLGATGGPAAVSVHAYLRRVECLRALTQFVTALEVADPADGVVRYFGANSLRAYESAVDEAGVVS